MKKLIPFFVLGTIASANAQVVIDESDFPTIGDSFTFGNDVDVTDLGLNLGTTGTGQTYDFSMLVTDELEVVGFYDPSTVQSGSDFPTADMAVDQSQAYAFAEVGGGEVNIIGLGGDMSGALGLPVPLTLSIPATDPWTIFTFPSSLGTSFADTANFDQTVYSDGLVPSPYNLVWDPDSVRIGRTVYMTSEMDAEGTLLDVLGTTHDVLRMNVVETNIDTVWGWTASGGWELAPSLLGYPATETTYKLRFISDQAGYYVVEIVTDEQGAPLSATFFSDQSECCTGVEDIVAAGQTVLYPNPTNGVIRVRTGGDIYQLNIMDVSGKLLQSERLTIDGQTVELNNLANGLYVYQMVDENGKTVYTGRLSCIK
jgi:hypothetical protein